MASVSAAAASTAATSLESVDDAAPPTAAKRPRVVAQSHTQVVAGVELARGAEGVVLRGTYLGRAAVQKTRFPKKYRHPVLDRRLTQRRIAGEARTLLRLRRSGVRVPAVYAVDASNGVLVLEEISGSTVKNWLCGGAGSGQKAVEVMRMVGAAVRGMHDVDVVHGDLTTSNVIVSKGDDRVVLIDFGLSSQSGAEEDKAVDLYVLERAIDAAHPEHAAVLNSACFDGYSNGGQGRAAIGPVLSRLEEVRSRGRKRDMIG